MGAADKNNNKPKSKPNTKIIRRIPKQHKRKIRNKKEQSPYSPTKQQEKLEFFYYSGEHTPTFFILPEETPTQYGSFADHLGKLGEGEEKVMAKPE